MQAGPHAEPEPDGPLDDLMPDSYLMAVPWADCLRWAIANPEIVESYRRMTGATWRPSGDALGDALDHATGADLQAVRAFVRWFNDNIWGDLYIPGGSS